MSGSYGCLIDRVIHDEDYEGGFSLIENMGDAHECIEELFWLVEKYIGREAALEHLEIFNQMKRGEIPNDDEMNYVEEKMNS